MKIKAAEFTGPREVTIVEEELPEPKANEVEIKSLFSGISHGTEMNVYRGDAPMWSMKFEGATRLFRETDEPSFSYPIRYGYSCVGEVTKAGADVTRLKEGDVVFCEGPHATGHVMNADGPTKLPDGIDPRIGVFLANLRTTFIGVLDAGLRLNECLVVFGQGILGQFVVQWAKLSGANPVVAVDLNDTRLGISKDVSGADVTMNPSRDDVALAVRELIGRKGADVAVEVSASDRALHEAIRTVCYNGRVIVLSWYPGALDNVYLNREFHLNRVQLICSQTCGIAAELSNRWTLDRVVDTVVERMPTMNLEPLIRHVIPLDDAADAYRMIDEGQEDVMQVVLAY